MSKEHRTYVRKMIKSLRALITYPTNVTEEQKKNVDATRKRICQLQEVILCVVCLNLEPIRPELESLYAFYTVKPGGNVPHDPVVMFRCLLLMFLCQQTSFKEWVELMDGHPELAIISGFEKRPGVGTFYDFRDRLLDGPYKKPCEHHQRPSQLYKGKRMCFPRKLKQEKKDLKEETQAELAEKNEGVVENLVKKALAAAQESLPADFLNRIETLLWKVAVIPSAQMGLLGDLKKLVASIDGSAIASRDTGNGKRLCTCHQQGLDKCSCARGYADPEATWGWDSYNEKYFFGFRFHLMAVISTLGTTLPIHLMIGLAHHPDVVMAVTAIARAVKLLQKYLPEAQIDKIIADLGYDATWFHILLRDIDKLPIIPIIPIRSSTKTPADLNGVPRDEQGRPLCEGGLPYKRLCHNKRQDTTVYHCPAKNIGRDHHADLKLCPLGAFCEPDSKLGPYLRIPSSDNPRLDPPIPRNSPLFEKIFKQRTCAERFYSDSKHNGGLNRFPYFRKDLYLIAGMGHAISCHAKSWVKLKWGDKRTDNAEELLDWLEQFLNEQELQKAA